MRTQGPKQFPSRYDWPPPVMSRARVTLVVFLCASASALQAWQRQRAPGSSFANQQMRAMSHMGQTRTRASRFGTSVPPPIADIARLHAQVRFVPTADIDERMPTGTNLRPHRYERSTRAGNSSKISVSRSKSCTFVFVCSRGFCRISGGVNGPTALSAQSPSFDRCRSPETGRR